MRFTRGPRARGLCRNAAQARRLRAVAAPEAPALCRTEPNESFYTSSNHRLRDSHVGRSGHWVDIEVFGKVGDEDLAAIERLAQMTDTRPVRVRLSRDWAKSSIKDAEP